MKSQVRGGSKLVGKRGQFSTGIFSLHETCLKHAKNRNTGDETMGMHFYKSTHEVFLAYHKYIDFFLKNGNCKMENLGNN